MLNDNDTYFDKNAFESLMSSQPTFSSLYSSQFVEEDPWGSMSDPVADIRQPLLSPSSNAVDDDILEQGITAASVLVGIDLPEVYDSAYIKANPQGDRLSLSSLEAAINLSGLPPRILEKIRALVVPSNAEYATRNEFNTALALVACAQKNMELPLPSLPNLEMFDEKRHRAPSHSLSTIINDTSSPSNTSMTSPKTTHSTESPPNKEQVLEDPWRKPGDVNGNADRTITPAPPALAPPPHDEPSNMYVNGGFKLLDSDDWFSDLDTIKLTIAPEREGFLFKHVIYTVSSHQRSSLVLRRYSDFYWLWQILTKVYPFRVVPTMPPKKVDIRGYPVFLESRRQGLNHFINFVARHPVLKKDKLVDIFLTEPSEFLAWRRANVPDENEEFMHVNQDLDMDDMAACIPKDLDERLQMLEKRLPQLLYYYQVMHDTMKHVAQLDQAQKKALDTFGHTLMDLGDMEKSCHVPDCQGCPHLTRGYDSINTYLRNESNILEQEANTTLDGIAMQLKQHHDSLLAFQETLDRRQKLSVNQIDGLSKRLAGNRARANQNRGVPGLEANVGRLDEAIQSDHERLVYQQRRDLFIRYCIHGELTFLHKQQAFIATMYQTYINEKLQHSRRHLDNWKALQVLMCSMPDLQEFH
ncbi:hypothetical protein DM01DRAFT_1349340 [Hesseltinella vesiculosa]|uniref:Sorting nexin MVP1 n=1 Tax=Hesseltinella vesiculosa TaxID=101127 RepID=A0A1X2G5Q5_9FUNG|nr:hypothetical protein DM01DRAFT_1349340 [Hesseltinella vesiculosa]